VNKIAVIIFGALLLALPALGERIHTIRVAPLVSNQPMQQSYADLMTAKLISHLTTAGVSVIEGESDTPTDAVLNVTFSVREVAGVGGSWYHIEGPARLTDMDGKVIWADEAHNTKFAHSSSTSFAEDVARKVEAFLSTQK
jgi:TolB-like protein